MLSAIQSMVEACPDCIKMCACLILSVLRRCVCREQRWYDAAFASTREEIECEFDFSTRLRESSLSSCCLIGTRKRQTVPRKQLNAVIDCMLFILNN